MRGSDKNKAETPLMRQHREIKTKYPGAILLFRVGDFYETFGEDAIITAQVLGITLTKRSNGAAADQELAGFPYHSLDTYLPKLVRAGHRVAVVDQLEDPKQAKGIVKRGVTELVTPGIALNDKILETKRYNYLMAILFSHSTTSAAFIELSTGDFFCFSGKPTDIQKVTYALQPTEIIVGRTDYPKLIELLGKDYHIFRLEDWPFQYDTAYKILTHHFRTASLKGFGVQEEGDGIRAAGALLHYLHENEQKNLSHIHKIYVLPQHDFMMMDKFTLRNLEIIEPIHPEGKSLADTLDCTLTPMGARLLRRWLVFPLSDLQQIQYRQNTVETFIIQQPKLAELASFLKNIGDLERTTARLAARKISPREATQLRNALHYFFPLFELLQQIAPQTTQTLIPVIPDIQEAVTLLKKTLLPECPVQTNAGNIIQDGISDKLDEYRNIRLHAQAILSDIQEREIAKTGISSLKISFNNVFGYYIEITNTHKHKVPPDYIRKQTLTNAERYITPELKQLEEKILHAEDRMVQLESELYQELIEKLLAWVTSISAAAKAAAEIDVLRCFAWNAIKLQYCKPEFHENPTLEIVEGRHPVIEILLPRDKPFIPNDIYLSPDNQQILLITGPNMSGKSVILRQTALIVLLAQSGSFVPATQVHLGIVDRLFTRVGASDNVSAGESTFMVEMNETAQIVHQATPRSLVLLDEIGRGTSTYDGISIAWALVEYLHNEPSVSAKTLFATHYHELAALDDQLPRVQNYHVQVQETQEEIIFLRKIVPGNSEHSFGIHVAELAGIPKPITQRAHEILKWLESQRDNRPAENQNLPTIKKTKIQQPLQLQLFALADEQAFKVRKEIEEIDIERLTPIEALLKLQYLKRLLEH